MNTFRFVILTFIAVTLGGCGLRVSQPSQSIAKEAVNNLTYAKDERTGQCFGIVSSAPAGKIGDQSMSITWVPCDPKVLEQIDQ